VSSLRDLIGGTTSTTRAGGFLLRAPVRL